MNIWFDKNVHIDQLNAMSKHTIAQVLGIEFIEISEDFIKAKMPVDHRTHQPFGLLHGGASAVLAETLGSVASYLCVDSSTKATVGIEINCNHIRSVKKGHVTGITKALHIGTTIQVWEINIYDDREKLVCTSRLTVAVIKKP